MWRIANKRKRTSCILFLVTIFFLWFFFREIPAAFLRKNAILSSVTVNSRSEIKEDGRHLKDLTKKASFYMNRNKTMPVDNVVQPTKKSFEEKLKETAVVVHQRVENMKKLCRSNFSFYNGYLNEEAFKHHSIFNNRYKFIMCLAEKTGCSFFKRVLYFYSGHKNISNPFILSLGAAHVVPQNLTVRLDDDKLASIMASYFKFIFVRDPFKRLFSGYVDKIFSRYDFWGSYSGSIVNQFRPNATSMQKKCGYDTTFPEFVKFVINRMSRREGFNGHFLPIYQHCNPCTSNFDFIGKLEHFYDDASYLFRKLNLGHQEIVSKAKAVSIDDEFVDAASIAFHDRDNKGLQKNICFNWYNFVRRTWRKLQVKGLISTKIPLPLNLNDLKLMSLPQFVTLLKAAHADSQADPEFHLTKKYAFLEAYYSVPKSDLEELAELMRPESQIWGYPVRPKELFDYKNRLPLKAFKFFSFDDV